MRLVLGVLALALLSCDGQSAAPASVVVAGAPLPLTGRVVDAAGIIPAAEEAAITRKLETLERDTTDQLVVVTVNGLGGVPIEKVAKDLGNGWGIGRADVDNGVILLVAPNERKVRIQVGFGLEGLLTNDRAQSIIWQMLPRFKGGAPLQAIEIGVDQISAVLESEKGRPQPVRQKKAA